MVSDTDNDIPWTCVCCVCSSHHLSVEQEIVTSIISSQWEEKFFLSFSFKKISTFFKSLLYCDLTINVTITLL